MSTSYRPYFLSGVESQPIEWLWQGRLARGTVTILESDPGMGKGLIAMDIAARLTRDLPMPGDPEPASASGHETPGPAANSDQSKIQNPKSKIQLPSAVVTPEHLNTSTPEEADPRQTNANVILCSSEDSRALTQKARAEAAGADLQRIICIDPLLSFEYTEDLDAAREWLNVIERILRPNDISLIIIDPLFGFLPALSCAAEKDARWLLAALANIAERRNCAILAIRHLTKQRRASAIHRGSGSIAYSAAARIILTLESHSTSTSTSTSPLTPDPSSLLLTCIKNNISERPKTLAFEIVPANNGSARIKWLGQYCPAPLQLVEPGVRVATALRNAEQFLLATLSCGPADEVAIRAAGAQQGISHRTLKRAKKSLGIRSLHPTARQNTWRWFIPSPEPEGQNPSAQHLAL